METVTFNGVDISALFMVADMSRPLPEFRDSSTTVEGADGDSFDALTIGPRECSFTVISAHRTMRELQDDARELMAVLAVREPKPLTFSDERDRDGVQLVRYAVPTGSFDAQEFVRAGQWTLRFRQHDPYLYGKPRSVVLAANEAQRVDVGGNAPAIPLATTAPRASSYLLRSGSGYISYFAPFDGNSTLTLDFAELTARLSPALEGAKGLQTGSRFFEFAGVTSLFATAQTTVSWTERWL